MNVNSILIDVFERSFRGPTGVNDGLGLSGPQGPTGELTDRECKFLQVLLALILVLGLIASGCESTHDPPIGFRDTELGPNAKVHGGEKPVYREVTDELGVQKGWKF